MRVEFVKEFVFFLLIGKMTTIKVSDEQEIISRLSSYVQKISNDAIHNRGKFYIGLSGKFSFIFSTYPNL